MNASTSSVIPGSTGAKLAVAGICLVVALILIFGLNAKYHFLPRKWDLLRIYGIIQTSDATYWTTPSSVSMLEITNSKLPVNFPARFGYTLMFDTMIFNTRASFSTTQGGTLPYRHLLHRGSSDLGTEYSSNSSTDLKGLPKYMNPGFIGDPTTNDIHVFIDTSAGRESTRISNLQLTTPYRIGIIVYEGFFELYLGCKLLISQVLKGMPIAINPSGVYGLAGSYALRAKIQNLRLWNTPLPIQEIVHECNLPIQSFGGAPSCSSVPTNLATPSPATSPAADVIANITDIQYHNTS